jgi:hypothetical protein
MVQSRWELLAMSGLVLFRIFPSPHWQVQADMQRHAVRIAFFWLLPPRVSPYAVEGCAAVFDLAV